MDQQGPIEEREEEFKQKKTSINRLVKSNDEQTCDEFLRRKEDTIIMKYKISLNKTTRLNLLNYIINK